MDVNNVPFWQLRTAREFGLETAEPNANALEWCVGRQALVLADLDGAPELDEDETRARELAQAPSCIADAHGGFAWWDDVQGRISVSGFAPGPVPLDVAFDAALPGPPPSDLALGDDVVFAARGGKVAMLDLRDRWPIEIVEDPDFDVGLASAADGHEPWLLDINTHRLARVRGTPLPSVARSFRRPSHFAEDANRNDPRIVVQPGLEVPESLEPVAMRLSAGGQIAILCWNAGEEAEILILEAGQLRRSRPLAGIRFPTSFAWNGEDELCVLATDGTGLANRAFAYDREQLLGAGGAVRPNGRFLPLLEDEGHGLANHPARGAVHIALRTEPSSHRIARRLAALSRAARSEMGSVLLGPIDGRVFDCCWHRFYAEAKLPEGCGMRVALHASNRIDEPARPNPEQPDTLAGWALHLAGAAKAWPEPAIAETPIQWPRAAWCHSASEVPGHAGFFHGQRDAGRNGLFTCLVQDGRRAVRKVKGRYLYIHIELTSNGRATPELYALRMYGNRFSYADRYLPELYGETLGGEEARAPGPATPPDFLERFVHLMEGPMSEMEARVVDGWAMTDADGVPDTGLDWLAAWTGHDLSGEIDPVRKRQKLLAAPHLARMNGTPAGLAAALELESGGHLVRGGLSDPDLRVPRPGHLAQIAIEGTTRRALVLEVNDPRSGAPCTVLTGGDVSAGRIIAVEGFRLRRTMGTIIGRELGGPDDPLLPGRPPSGNSIVGDSLILGEEDRAALLSRFGPEIAASEAERNGLASFYRTLAHTVLVLVRREGAGTDLSDTRILKAARAASPAHVRVELLPMSAPFITGVASLIGIDSFLGEPFVPGEVVLGDEGSAVSGSALGRTDRLTGSGALDNRGEVPAGPAPVARADGPANAHLANGFVLEGGRSRAGPGRSINRFVWTWN